VKDIVVVGAGLAGLTVGRLLAQQGFEVTVLESSARCGGKAGADTVEGRVWEHGYHIFPPWYVNVRPLLQELGVTLIDFDRWHSRVLGADGKARWVTSEVPTSLPSLYRSLTQGLLPWPDAVLYWYFVLDMLAEPLSNKALLDQVSRIGLMRGRWYVNKHIPEMEAENVLKASAIPLYEMSAMTAKKISAFWIRTPAPFLSILPGDLQATFIDPYVRRVEQAGVKLRLEHTVTRIETRDGRVSGVRVRTQDGAESELPADALVVTTPLEVTRRLMNEDLQKLDPDLGRFEHLQAAPMASLHLKLKTLRTDLPREHCFLHGGRYGLSFIDNGPHWGLSQSYLSFISSNFIPLQELPVDAAFEALLGEIQTYLDLPRDQIEAWYLRPNVETPLFINTVGAWDNRATARSDKVPNLYFAGDWAKNPVDLACMEGAVSSAMHTARVLAEDHGVTGLPKPREPMRYSPLLMRIAKWALAPAMVPLAAVSRLE
jgi:predicted NAD/FAD-dependent oxidoreductase